MTYIYIYNLLDFLRRSCVLPEAGEVVLDLLGSGHDGLNLLFGALALTKKQYLSTCISLTQYWVEYNQFVRFS